MPERERERMTLLKVYDSRPWYASKKPIPGLWRASEGELAGSTLSCGGISPYLGADGVTVYFQDIVSGQQLMPIKLRKKDLSRYIEVLPEELTPLENQGVEREGILFGQMEAELANWVRPSNGKVHEPSRNGR